VTTISATAAPANPLTRPLTEVFDNSAGLAVPSDGTGSKILAHRTGAPGVIRAQRALSTGRPVQGQRMDDETRFLAAPCGGVRFGVYTDPMTMQTASALVVSSALGAEGR